jgi:hypothetical protein
VSVLWNDDNTEVYNTISGVIGTGYTLSDLSSNVAYYGKDRSTAPDIRGGRRRGDLHHVLRQIYDSLTVLTDTSIRIEWTGMYSVVDIELSLNDSFV